MAVIFGTLNDFSLGNMTDLRPTLVFTASGPAMTTGGGLLSTKPIEVVPASNTKWSVELVSTDELVAKDVYYTVAVKWFDSAGNYISVDFPDWKIYVPVGGGPLTNLVQTPVNPSLIWVSLTPPPNPSSRMKWLESDPYGADGSGILYEWSI